MPAALDLATILTEAEAALAGAATSQALIEVRARFLGKRGSLSGVLRGLAALRELNCSGCAGLSDLVPPREPERRREIAILRALGARRGTIFSTVILESAAISALGLWVASEIFQGLKFESTSKLLVAAVLLGARSAASRVNRTRAGTVSSLLTDWARCARSEKSGRGSKVAARMASWRMRSSRKCRKSARKRHQAIRYHALA